MLAKLEGQILILILKSRERLRLRRVLPCKASEEELARFEAFISVNLASAFELLSDFGEVDSARIVENEEVLWMLAKAQSNRF